MSDRHATFGFGKLLVCAPVGIACAYFTFETARAFTTGAEPNLDYTINVILGLSALAGLAFGLAAGKSMWRGLLWADRSALLSLGAMACCFHDQFGTREWIATAGLVVGGLFLQKAAKARALGFFVDENGERQRVLGTSRGHFIYKPTSLTARIVEESEMRSERQQFFLIVTPLLALLGYGIYHFYLLGSWVWVAVLAFPAFMLTLGWISQFWQFLLYASGNQFVKGAKAVDRPTRKKGLQDVEEQEIHGGSRFLNEADSQRALRSGQAGV